MSDPPAPPELPKLKTTSPIGDLETYAANALAMLAKRIEQYVQNPPPGFDAESGKSVLKDFQKLFTHFNHYLKSRSQVSERAEAKVDAAVDKLTYATKNLHLAQNLSDLAEKVEEAQLESKSGFRNLEQQVQDFKSMQEELLKPSGESTPGHILVLCKKITSLVQKLVDSDLGTKHDKSLFDVRQDIQAVGTRIGNLDLSICTHIIKQCQDSAQQLFDRLKDSHSAQATHVDGVKEYVKTLITTHQQSLLTNIGNVSSDQSTRGETLKNDMTRLIESHQQEIIRNLEEHASKAAALKKDIDKQMTTLQDVILQEVSSTIGDKHKTLAENMSTNISGLITEFQRTVLRNMTSSIKIQHDTHLQNVKTEISEQISGYENAITEAIRTYTSTEHGSLTTTLMASISRLITDNQNTVLERIQNAGVQQRSQLEIMKQEILAAFAGHGGDSVHAHMTKSQSNLTRKLERAQNTLEETQQEIGHDEDDLGSAEDYFWIEEAITDRTSKGKAPLSQILGETSAAVGYLQTTFGEQFSDKCSPTMAATLQRIKTEQGEFQSMVLELLHLICQLQGDRGRYDSLASMQRTIIDTLGWDTQPGVTLLNLLKDSQASTGVMYSEQRRRIHPDGREELQRETLASCLATIRSRLGHVPNGTTMTSILQSLLERQSRTEKGFNTLNSRLLNDDGLLQSLSNRISSVEQSVSTVNSSVGQLEFSFNSKLEEVGQKIEDVNRLRQINQDKGEQLSQKNVQLTEKERQMSEKDQQLSQKDRQLSEKDAEIAELKRQLALHTSSIHTPQRRHASGELDTEGRRSNCLTGSSGT